MTRWLLAIVGVAITVVAGMAIVVQSMSGAQPWGATLSDNMVFAKVIPFALGLGVLVGAFRATGASQSDDSGQDRVERRASGELRRFSPGAVVVHWTATLGVLLGLVTGSWLYLKGVLDVPSPVEMFLVYRTHYIAATLLLFSVASFATYWWIESSSALLIQRGQWIRNLRGLSHELGSPLGGLLTGLLGLDTRRQPPPTEQFTYYEKCVSFPTWVILIGLIVVTGMLKAMRYLYPIPGELLWWASAFHVGGLVLLAVKVLDHLRYVFAPGRWPLLMSMVTTWIDEGYVRTHLAGWLQGMEKGQRAVDTPARASPSISPGDGQPASTVGSARVDG